MTGITATLSIGASTAQPSSSSAQSQLSPVDQGDIAAGRARLVEGRAFQVCPAGQPCNAPPITDWGKEPEGSGYREAFDQASARLGTTDPAIVATEIERQLYGTPAAATSAPPASVPAAEQAAGSSNEGIGSFFDGAIRGDYSGNSSWSATAGQVLTGFVPIAGQIADARDLSAAVKNWRSGEGSGWGVLAAGVGFLPGGDIVKGAIRGADKAAGAVGDVAEQIVKRSDPDLIARNPLLTSAPNAHAVTRHGGAVTEDQLITRARTGLTPDGKQAPVPPTMSSAFHSDALLVATDKAIRENGALDAAIKAAPAGANKVTVKPAHVGDLGQDLGRGYERIGKDTSLQGPLNQVDDLRSAEGIYSRNAAGQWETITLYPAKVAP